MKIDIEIGSQDIKKLIKRHLESILGEVEIKEEDIHISTKSKQNYKAEWETADFKVNYTSFK